MLHIGRISLRDYVVFGNFTSDGPSLTVKRKRWRSTRRLLPSCAKTEPLVFHDESLYPASLALFTAVAHQFPFEFLPTSRTLHRVPLSGAFELHPQACCPRGRKRIRDLKEAAAPWNRNWPDPAFPSERSTRAQ